MENGNAAGLIECIFSPDRLGQASLIQTGLHAFTFTYASLRDCVDSIQSELVSLGLGNGSVCCISLPNSPSFIAVFLAVVAIGATAAPLNPAMKKDEILFALADLDADLLVGPSGFLDSTSELAKAAAHHHCHLAECTSNQQEVALNVRRSDTRENTIRAYPQQTDFVALALHTSGTTGRPKGVPLLQSNLLASARNVRDAYQVTPEDRSILIMPLFHIHGIVAGLLTPLMCGSCVIIPERGLGPSFWDDFSEHKATWWTATPSHHKVLLSFPPPKPGIQPRFIRSCSSPLPPSLLAKMEQTFNAPVLEAYAMTENAHHIASTTETGPRKVGSVGLACPGISLKVIDENGKEVHAGVRGEIVIKGPSVMSGYRHNPEANMKAFTGDGFFRTGDQGELDQDGHLRLTGRLKEIINKGGEKVAPNEIDNVMLEQDDVAEAVTFGIPDEHYGEDVGMAVVLKQGRQTEPVLLKRWLRERLSAFKIPRQLWIVDSIPKTATGKVQRSMVAKAVSLEPDMLSPAELGKISDLKDLWSRVLDIEAAKINDADDFFNLGGDSVAAIRLANEAQARGWAFDAASVFRHTTLQDMASVLVGSSQAPSTVAPISEPTGSDGLAKLCANACGVSEDLVEDVQPLTPLQGRLVVTNRESGAWIMPLAFSCKNVSLELLEACVSVVRSRNAVLRTRMVYVQEKYFNVCLLDEAVWDTGTDLAKYCDTMAGMRILYGCPHVRFAYIQDSKLGTHFVLTASHAVTDVWTRSLLYEEIQRGLQDIDALKSSPPAPSFAKFAKFVDEIDRDDANRYYSSLLEGFERSSYLNQVSEIDSLGLMALDEVVPLAKWNIANHSKTLLIHLAWTLALSSLSGDERIFFASASSGRLAGVPGIEAIMGPTLTIIPVCIDLSAHRTVSEALNRMRAVLYDGVRFEALAPAAMIRHFGSPRRETLLNCSDVAERDGQVVKARNGGELRMRLEKGKTAYGRMSMLLNMRVTEDGTNDLRLRTAFDRSQLAMDTVKDLVRRFAACLVAVNGAGGETTLDELKAATLSWTKSR